MTEQKSNCENCRRLISIGLIRIRTLTGVITKDNKFCYQHQTDMNNINLQKTECNKFKFKFKK